MRQIIADDIRDGLHSDDPPPKLIDLKRLQLPVNFRDGSELPSQCSPAGKFPFQGDMMACLYAASRKGVDLQDIDFVIGGSILAFFAERGKKATYLLQKCPGTQIMVISKQKTYVQNFAAKGFQFERLVTGEDMYGLHDLTIHEHLQVFRIGNYRALLTAEVDAIDDQGRPVEMKVGDPSMFGFREMFQMLSSGAQVLIHPYTRGMEVRQIACKPIADLAGESESGSEELEEMDHLILAAFRQLDAAKRSMKSTPHVIVLSNGQLSLHPKDCEGLLPEERVVEELLDEEPLGAQNSE